MRSGTHTNFNGVQGWTGQYLLLLVQPRRALLIFEASCSSHPSGEGESGPTRAGFCVHGSKNS